MNKQNRGRDRSRRDRREDTSQQHHEKNEREVLADFVRMAELLEIRLPKSERAQT
jgi:hypothetical protein